MVTAIDALTEVRREIQRHINAGANREAIAAARGLLDSPVARELPSSAIRTILGDEARARRNVGDIPTALARYTTALESAYDDGDELATAWQLVLLGKFFGKYLNRRVFFHACLEEARRRYDHAGDEDGRHRKHRAILFDLLGSYHRHLAEHDPAQLQHAEEAYIRALELHTHPDGISRATCHLAYVRGLSAAAREDPAERTAGLRDAVRMFEDGLRYTLVHPSAVRGRATRLAQRADLYFRLGAVDRAQEFANTAVHFARETRDNRALIETAKIKAEVMRHLDRIQDAIDILQEARKAAEGNRLHGLQRNINALLIDCYFATDHSLDALALFQENDELMRREVSATDVQIGEVLRVFRKVTPQHADRYLFEGLQRDHAAIVEQMLVSEQRLRDSLAEFQQARSAKRENSLSRFTRSSQRHTIRNELALIGVDLRGIAADLGGSEHETTLEQIARRIEGLKVSASGYVEETGDVLILQLIEKVAAEMLGAEHVEIARGHDVLFRNVQKSRLREALVHLVENIRQAIAEAPPRPGVPHLRVAQELRRDGLEIRLLNPGSNPVDPPRVANPSDPQHGYETAATFLSSYLDVHCDFLLIDEGPASSPYRTNCVTLWVPEPSDFHRIIPDEER